MTSKKETSHVQQDWQDAFSSFFGTANWQQLATDNMKRAKNVGEEWQKLEKSGADQLNQAIDEGSRLLHESLDYGQRLTSAWRKAAFEAAERSLTLVNPKA